MSEIIKTSNPPYYAVIFTSLRTDGDNGYSEMADEMVELVSEQPGFLGVEGVRGADNFGITISYWESLEAINEWKENPRHLIAQKLGKEKWYKKYATRVCKIERDNFGSELV